MEMKNRHGYFSDISQEEWNDWKWQFRHRITNVDGLKKVLNLTRGEEEGIGKCLKTMDMALTPYYLSLIEREDPNDVIRRQVMPALTELYRAPEDMDDPLGEESNSPVEGLRPIAGTVRESGWWDARERPSFPAIRTRLSNTSQGTVPSGMCCFPAGIP
jgi:hypothetical protein